MFGCSKVSVVNRHATTGQYINQDSMVAILHAMVAARDPLVAIPQAITCKNRYAEAVYKSEVAVAAAVKLDALTLDVIAQVVMTNCQH